MMRHEALPLPSWPIFDVRKSMHLPLILAHGDIGFVIALLACAGVAVLASVVSVVAALLKKGAARSRVGIAAGITAIILGGPMLILVGWPPRFAAPMEVALVIPVPLGIVGLLLSQRRHAGPVEQGASAKTPTGDASCDRK